MTAHAHSLRSSSMAPGRSRRLLLALVLIGLVAVAIRGFAIMAWSGEVELAGDQKIYHDKANSLADFVGFTLEHPAGERITTANHPPLHATILGAASVLGADGELAHRLIGALLGGLTAVVAGLAAWRISEVGLRAAGGKWASCPIVAGIAAAFAVAVAPTLWINDSMVLSESTFALMIAVVILSAAELVARPSLMRTAILAAAVGLSALTRAEALTLAPLLLIPLVLLTMPPGRRLKGSVVGVLVVAVMCAPWLGRNLTSFERPVLMSSGTGFVLEIANCDETYYGDRLGYWSVECDRTPWEMGDESTTEEVKRSTGVSYMRDNAGRLPVVVGARVGRMWDLWRPEESVWLNSFYERRGDASSRAAMYVWWGMLAVGGAGAWSLRRRPVLLLPFAALGISTSLAAAVSFGITRYRTGLEVAMAVLAGIAVGAAWGWYFARRDRGVEESEPAEAT